MVAEHKGPDTRVGRPGEHSEALRGRCADLHSRRAQGTQGYYRTEALATVSKGFSTEGERLGTSEVQLEDGATQLLKLIRIRLGKDLQQDVSEHYKRFLHRSARLYQQSMQHYIAEESNLHERTMQAVKSVSTPGKDEPETKEIIANVGKRGTHRIRTSLCLRCRGKELRVQSHRQRAERNLGPRRPSQEP